MRIRTASLFALSALFVFFLASCKGRKAEEVPPSSGEIINKYVETLSTAPQKARDAANVAGGRAEMEEKAIKEIEQ